MYKYALTLMLGAALMAMALAVGAHVQRARTPVEHGAVVRCGAYDARFVGHDAASAHDAWQAALSSVYVDGWFKEGCEIERI